MIPEFYYSPEPVLIPQPGCSWANKMVLNPAIVKDPSSDRLHMLFRATGPWPQKRLEGRHDPYPIFLGYAWSDDGGNSWEADFSRPALAPALEQNKEDIYISDICGRQVQDYSNGCIEDPRIFPIEGELYLSAACRMFPPGPYWLEDQDPPVITRYEYVPDWVHDGEDPFTVAARTNDTVTVLFKLRLDRLAERCYEEAFTYVCPLTEGHVSDNRDVFLFPEKMVIDGRLQYVMLHRPKNPKPFPDGDQVKQPSIYLACADSLNGFASPQASHRLLAEGIFDWEKDRIGASWAPLSLGDGEWLIGYHGKKDIHFGYTQSFMIVKEQENDFPAVTHRCPDRLMYAQQEWEMPSDYPTPCLFTTAGILLGDELVMAYGAADQKIGISRVSFTELVKHVRRYSALGELL
jgi:beta-1,2-mannobiose phosphorylase / 1,2-beta-oligomannan phosphorylase